MRQKLLALADRFELGEHDLLACLPHWGRISEDSGLGESSDGAAFFRSLHQGAVLRNYETDEDVDEAADSLERLALNPRAEMNCQLSGAIAQARGQSVEARQPAQSTRQAAANER